MESLETTRKGNGWLGILPFIGIIVFLVHAVSILSNDHQVGWKKNILLSGITNMIGIAGIGAGISHIFFADKINRSIGFQSSPYQIEVGFCDLSFGIVGLLAQYYSIDFWWSIIFFSSIYRIGCGIGHIRQIIFEKKYAINNTMILVVNFGVPFILVSMYLFTN